MKNPFISMALAAVAIAASARDALKLNNRMLDAIAPPTHGHSTHGPTVAQAKRIAIKAKNRAKHRAHCRGAR
jgi:hypothetical protein